MIDNISISDLKDGSVKIERCDHTGIVIDICVIPKNEWLEYRARVIRSVSASFSLSDAFTLLTGLSILLDTE
jgi:hypothetical protein